MVSVVLSLAQFQEPHDSLGPQVEQIGVGRRQMIVHGRPGVVVQRMRIACRQKNPQRLCNLIRELQGVSGHSLKLRRRLARVRWLRPCQEQLIRTNIFLTASCDHACASFFSQADGLGPALRCAASPRPLLRRFPILGMGSSREHDRSRDGRSNLGVGVVDLLSKVVRPPAQHATFERGPRRCYYYYCTTSLVHGKSSQR